jgi:hypothetical protein
MNHMWPVRQPRPVIEKLTGDDKMSNTSNELSLETLFETIKNNIECMLPLLNLFVVHSVVHHLHTLTHTHTYTHTHTHINICITQNTIENISYGR